MEGLIDSAGEQFDTDPKDKLVRSTGQTWHFVKKGDKHAGYISHGDNAEHSADPNG